MRKYTVYRGSQNEKIKFDRVIKYSSYIGDDPTERCLYKKRHSTRDLLDLSTGRERKPITEIIQLYIIYIYTCVCARLYDAHLLRSK